jgi:hypothetical protein
LSTLFLLVDLNDPFTNFIRLVYVLIVLLFQVIHAYLAGHKVVYSQAIMSQAVMKLREPALIFGLGGIGGVYACILALGGKCDVHVVARSNYDAVKKNGYRMISPKFGNHEDIKFAGGEYNLVRRTIDRLVRSLVKKIADSQFGGAVRMLLRVEYNSLMVRYNLLPVL